MTLVVTPLMVTVLVKATLAARHAGQRAGCGACVAKEELSETYRGSERNNVEYQRSRRIKVFDDLTCGSRLRVRLAYPQSVILIDPPSEPYVDHVPTASESWLRSKGHHTCHHPWPP